MFKQTQSTSPGLSLGRTRGQFNSNKEDENKQVQVSEFDPNLAKSTKPSYILSKKQIRKNDHLTHQQWQDNPSQWLPKLSKITAEILNQMSQDYHLSCILDSTGFFYDQISSVSYKVTRTPEVIAEYLSKQRQTRDRVHFFKGFIDKINTIYYVIGNRVFLYKIKKDFNFGEPSQIVLSTNILLIAYGNYKSQNFHCQTKNNLIFVEADRLTLFQVQQTPTETKYVNLNLRIPVEQNEVKQIVITESGKIFYLDSNGKLNHVMDKKWFLGQQLVTTTKKIELTLYQKLKQKCFGNPESRTWLGNLHHAMKNTFRTPIEYKLYPLQILDNGESKQIFTLVQYVSNIHSYHQITLYSYAKQITILKTIKQEQITAQLLKKHYICPVPFQIIKLQNIDQHYSHLFNLQIILQSGMRLLTIFNANQFRIIRIIYPPDFQLYVKDPKKSVLEKESICAVDYSDYKNKTELKVVHTVNNGQRYACVYIDYREDSFQSYMEWRGYRESVSVGKIEWQSIKSARSALLIHEVNVMELQNSRHYQVLKIEKQRFNQSEKEKEKIGQQQKLNLKNLRKIGLRHHSTYELVEQIYNDATFHMLLTDQIIQFSIKLRPIDIIFGIIKHFEIAHIKTIIEKLVKKQYHHEQMIVTLINIICNEQLTCYVSKRVNLLVQNQLTKSRMQVGRVDMVVKETTDIELRERAYTVLEWMIQYHIHISHEAKEKNHVVKAKLEENKIAILHEQILAHCAQMYTARILAPLSVKTIHEINETVAQVILWRLNEINYFLTQKCRYYNEQAKQLKYFIFRARQLLLLLPKIRFQMDNKISFFIMINYPSKYFQQYVFKAHIKSKINHRQLWKHQQMLATRDIMIMIKIVDMIEKNSPLNQIQTTLDKIPEVPKFFVQYLMWKKMSVKINNKKFDNPELYFKNRIEEVTGKIKEARMNNRHGQAFSLIEERKLLRLKQYLIKYFEESKSEVNIKIVYDMKKEQIKELVEKACDSLSRTIVDLNFEDKQQEQEFIITQYLKIIQQRPPTQVVKHIQTILRASQPSSIPLKCLLYCLLLYYFRESTLFVQSPKMFNPSIQLQTATKICSIILKSNHQTETIVNIVLEFYKQIEYMYLGNLRNEGNCRKMLMMWMIYYHLIMTVAKERERKTEFVEITEKVVKEMEGNDLLTDKIVETFRKMVEEIK